MAKDNETHQELTKTVNVTSSNQQGGSTVGEQNIKIALANDQKDGLPKWALWCAFILTFVGVLVAILAYLRL